jgi:hypothetical protein
LLRSAFKQPVAELLRHEALSARCHASSLSPRNVKNLAFAAAWRVFLAKRTEADFEEYRRDRAFQAWKQAMWAAGLQLPTQAADGQAVRFCGVAIGLNDMDAHVYAAHMELKAT